MREWDEMVARQVAADGVRTTWGEHMPAMTDDTRSILSADEVRSERYRYPDSTTEDGANDVIALGDSHEALRAALAAAEERAEQADQLAATLLVQRNAAESDADEARATLRITGELLDAAEAERDQAIRERDEAREKAVDERADAWRWAFKATDAEAQVAALTAERDEWKGAAEWVQALARQDQAQVRTLREALPPSHRLRLLADWVDRKHPLDSDSEIQDALRGWADAIDAALGEQEATPPEPCAKCGYAGGCMEPWAAVSLDDPSDKVLIPCGTCPPCRASTPQGEAEPEKEF